MDKQKHQHKWSKRKYVAYHCGGYPFCKENMVKIYMLRCKCGMLKDSEEL
jgi:hypothetical protein